MFYSYILYLFGLRFPWSSILLSQYVYLTYIDWHSVVKLVNNKRFVCRAQKKPFHIDLNKIEFICMPYISQNHYTLLVLDLINQHIVQHNPMPDFEIISKEQIIAGVKLYFEQYNSINKTNFKFNKWKLITKKMPEQQDVVSCGIYILWYIQLYVHHQQNTDNLLFDGSTFRHIIQRRILEESDIMVNACLYCGISYMR